MSLRRHQLLLGALLLVHGEGTPRAQSLDNPSPSWREAILIEAGSTALEQASGERPAALYIGPRFAWRPRERWTLLGGYGFSWQNEGTADVHYGLQLHRLYLRGDFGLGTPHGQFYFGAGPAVFIERSKVMQGETTSLSGNVTGLGFIYALGLRGDWNHMALGFELGGQQRENRHDFVVTMLVGYVR